MSCSSSGETDFINTASGNCHSVLVAVSCVGWEFTLGRKLTEREHLEDPGVDGRIIVRWIFRKWDGGHGLD